MICRKCECRRCAKSAGDADVTFESDPIRTPALPVTAVVLTIAAFAELGAVVIGGKLGALNGTKPGHSGRGVAYRVHAATRHIALFHHE